MNVISLLRYSILVVMSILFILIIIIIFSSESVIESTSLKSCIDVNDLTNILYESCYDAFSKNIYFEIKNNNIQYDIQKIKMAFFDYSQNFYDLDFPAFNESEYYRVPATRNPFSAELFLIGNENFCETSKNVPINYCPSALSKGDEDISLSLISQASLKNFTAVESVLGDQIPVELVDSDAVWEGICKSSWKCGSWGTCVDNIQRRECTDTSKCVIPTGALPRVKACNTACSENWQCEWSKCKGGFTTPDCIDLNKCGTSIDKPKEIACQKKCSPDIICGEWSACTADYDFLTLSNGDYSLSGKQSRTCFDQEDCLPQIVENQECSLVIDVYTLKFTKCGKTYIGIYNNLDNKLLANIEQGENKDQLNIDLSGEEARFYCDYCFDGILDGDEEQIDCGGSCPSCDLRKVEPEYSRTFLEKVLDGVFGFLS